MRRSVQSYGEISLFPLDKSGFPSVVNNTFLSFRIRDKTLRGSAPTFSLFAELNLRFTHRSGFGERLASRRYSEAKGNNPFWI
jgi:hypothetical protein